MLYVVTSEPPTKLQTTYCGIVIFFVLQISLLFVVNASSLTKNVAWGAVSPNFFLALRAFVWSKIKGPVPPPPPPGSATGFGTFLSYDWSHRKSKKPYCFTIEAQAYWSTQNIQPKMIATGEFYLSFILFGIKKESLFLTHRSCSQIHLSLTPWNSPTSGSEILRRYHHQQ